MRAKPKIVKGKHTTFVYHRNGRVEMITDWDALAKEIDEALSRKPVKRGAKRGRQQTKGS
jgi:hypothetical protein